MTGTFKVRAGREAKYVAEYGRFLGPRTLAVTDTVIPGDIPLGGRKHLHGIRQQANGCYDNSFFDGCAVMCRRLVELLLIEAFSNAGHLNEISTATGDLKSFGDIIGTAKAGQHLRLSRGAGGVLDRIKEVGDAGAHHRYYITSKRDIDELNPRLRQLVAELAALSFP